MNFVESNLVELKETAELDRIKKTVIAFANTDGGKIYIGISDAGKVIGIENADFVQQQVSNSINAAIKPNVSIFTKIYTQEIDGKTIIVIEVMQGTARPYYLVDKGMKPSGVYYRLATSTLPASAEYIRQLIKQTDGDSYENNRSLNQDLTFNAANEKFKEKDIAFADSQKVSLGLKDNYGQFTNLGLLLSDQCPYTTKIGVFQDKDKSIFKNRRELSGSILSQFTAAEEFIDFYNQIKAVIGKLYRQDTKDYPEIAIREALLNCYIHREYGLNASVQVSIFEDRIEFLTIGGLVKGMTDDALKDGVSMCRNPKLANVFYRLSLIEAYGSGIPRIKKPYENEMVKPIFSHTDSSFKVVLPNLNYAHDHIDDKLVINDVESQIMMLIKNNKTVTAKTIETTIGLKKTRTTQILNSMINKGLIKYTIVGKARVYTL